MAKHKIKTPLDQASLPKPVPKHKPVPLTDALILAGAKLTSKQLKDGTYQRKLLELFAPHLGPELLQSIRRGLIADEPQARKLTAELLGYIQPKSGINVNVNQTNQTANVGGGGAEGRKARSFEEIARTIHDGRTRKALPSPESALDAEFVETPDDEE